MGFLDSLFGGGEPDVDEVAFSGLGEWFSGRLESFNAERVKEAKPILESVGKTVRELGKRVDRLDSTELTEDVGGRFEKIIKTNIFLN